MSKPEEKKVETNVVETPTNAPKPRKPREKVRPIEDLIELPEKKLTDKEKNILIKELKERLTFLENKTAAHMEASDGAFRRARETEEQYKAMESYYKNSFKNIQLQLDAAYKAIATITGGAA